MWLFAKEYGELCHAIRTKHADKIPEVGFILYNDFLYMYNYNWLDERIE